MSNVPISPEQPRQNLPRRRPKVDTWGRMVYREPYRNAPHGSGVGSRARGPWHIINSVTLEALCGTRLNPIRQREIRDLPYWNRGDEPRICGRCHSLSKKITGVPQA